MPRAGSGQHSPAPIAISANTTYVVSYLAPNGYYSADGAFFAGSPRTGAILHGLAEGRSGPNGVYLYGRGGFPEQQLELPPTTGWTSKSHALSMTRASESGKWPALHGRQPSP